MRIEKCKVKAKRKGNHNTLSSLSSYLEASSWQMQVTNSMPISFSEYLKRFESEDTYDDLMVALFEWQDLIIKTNEMKHLAGLVERFQNKVSALQEYMQELFDAMEASRLHQLLKKQYVWHEGTIRRWWELHFDLSNTVKRPSTIERPLTPYPRSRSPSPPIKKPIHHLWYSPTASQYSHPHHNMECHHNLQNLNPLAWDCHLFLIPQFSFWIPISCLLMMNSTIFYNGN